MCNEMMTITQLQFVEFTFGYQGILRAKIYFEYNRFPPYLYIHIIAIKFRVRIVSTKIYNVIDSIFWMFLFLSDFRNYIGVIR